MFLTMFTLNTNVNNFSRGSSALDELATQQYILLSMFAFNNRFNDALGALITTFSHKEKNQLQNTFSKN